MPTKKELQEACRRFAIESISADHFFDPVFDHLMDRMADEEIERLCESDDRNAAALAAAQEIKAAIKSLPML
jgi:hypothetical protein